MATSFLSDILHQKLLPAITFDDVVHATPVASALLAAGLHIMEVPLRTLVAEEAIAAIRKNCPAMYVGAGTILSTRQLQTAIAAGAQFGLSPGFNPLVCAEAIALNFPFIPGVMTPSEIELAAGMGFNILKLFPAAQIGGTGFIKAMEAPYEALQVKFIPMGGVNIGNMASYLQLNNVIAVGGSWLATKQLMDLKDYKQVEENIKAALQYTR